MKTIEPFIPKPEKISLKSKIVTGIAMIAFALTFGESSPTTYAKAASSWVPTCEVSLQHREGDVWEWRATTSSGDMVDLDYFCQSNSAESEWQCEDVHGSVSGHSGRFNQRGDRALIEGVVVDLVGEQGRCQAESSVKPIPIKPPKPTM